MFATRNIYFYCFPVNYNDYDSNIDDNNMNIDNNPNSSAKIGQHSTQCRVYLSSVELGR